MAKLFIVGFPKGMQEIELLEMFSLHGIVNTVTIVTDRETGDSRGYGFITMADDHGAERAIAALDGTSIGGRTINVRVAENKAKEQATLLNPNTSKTFSPSSRPKQKTPGFIPVKKKRPRL